MAQEALDAIKEAEQRAEQIAREAASEADKIIADAVECVRNGIVEYGSELKEKSAQVINDARAQAEKNSIAHMANAQEEALNLEKQLKKKHDAAVKMVIEAISK